MSRHSYVTLPVAVDLKKFGDEFARLWRGASVGEGFDAAGAVTRPLAANLLILARSRGDLLELQPLISDLAAQNPMRVVMAASDIEDQSSAQLSMMCTLDDRGRHFCGEQITISSREAGSILPLVDASLPIYLWALDGCLDDSPNSDDLLKLSDVYVVDISLVNSIQLEKIAGFAGSGRLVVRDIAWTSLAKWQEAIASLFDSDRFRSELPKIDRLRVTHGASNAFAAIIVSWLFVQLHWVDFSVVRRDKRGVVLSCKSPNGLVNIEIFESDHSEWPIDEIEVRSTNGRFAVSASPQPGYVKLVCNLSDEQEQRSVQTVGISSQTEALAQITSRQGRDIVFERALPVLSAITAMLEDRR